MANDIILKQLLKDISIVEQGVLLGRFNGLGVGGRATYFTVARDATELASAVKAAIDAELPYEVIGSGASVLFPDTGYDGLIIHNLSQGFIMATDRSQVVVESGMPLQRFITMAAGRGYGGMTQFFGQPGTVGGALYHNIVRDGTSILSSVRHLTMLMPPTKMKPYPTVVRQRAEWLLREDSWTRLRQGRSSYGFIQPHPIILNVQFQLTSVRPDELQRRIQRESKQLDSAPRGAQFGPLFCEPGGEHRLDDLLKYSGVSKLAVETLRPHKRNLNYISAKREVTSSLVWELMQKMRDLVRERSGIELNSYIEQLGDWTSTSDILDPMVG